MNSETTTKKIFDSNGVEIRPGDIVECPGEDLLCAWRYHVCFDDGSGTEIRDLGHNNLGTYDTNGPFYNIGHFSKHLDKLNEYDLDYYFGIKISPYITKLNRAEVTFTIHCLDPKETHE